MKKFEYKVKDQTGRLVTGIVEASSENLAASLVRKKGYVVITLKTSSFNLSSLFGKNKKVSAGEITVFTRQLSTMINAGLPVVEAISVLRVQAKPAFSEVLSQIQGDVEGGESFSAALSKHPKIFSSTFVALIKAGETGGVMDKVLNRLSDNMEKQQEFKGKVRGALIYPAIIVIGMTIVSILMMVFVIPQLNDLYDQFDAELPITTKILNGISNLLIKGWPIVLALVAGGGWGFWVYKKTPVGKRKIAKIFFKIPIVGPLQRQILLTEITRTMAMMIGAGVSILESLQVTSGVVGNVLMSDALNNASEQIEKGFPIAYSFAKEPDAFPFILSQMIAVGEETGKMDEVLTKLSHIFEVESEQKVKNLTAAVEPIVMIVLGLGVAFLVVSVILPIYNLTTAL